MGAHNSVILISIKNICHENGVIKQKIVMLAKASTRPTPLLSLVIYRFNKHSLYSDPDKYDTSNLQ